MHPIELSPSLAGAPWVPLAIDVLGLVLGLWVVRAGRIAPVPARVAASLALFAAGLAPLLVTLAPWLTTWTPLDATFWVGLAPGALLLALLLLAVALGRLMLLAQARRPVASVLEVLGLAIIGGGLVLVILPAVSHYGLGGLSLSASVGQLSRWLVPAGWAVALLGAALVLAANAWGAAAANMVSAGRRLSVVLTALGYALLVGAVTFVPNWLGLAVSGPLDSAAHAMDAVGLLAFAIVTRRVLNRPAAAAYWPSVSGQRHHPPRRHAGGAPAPRPTYVVPAIPTGATPVPTPALAAQARPLVPPAALAPFAPPALRRAVFSSMPTLTHEALQPVAPNPTPAPRLAQLAPLVVPGEVIAAQPGQSNALLAEDVGSRTRSSNRAPDRVLAPQFIEALLMLRAELAQAGRDYSFDELLALFDDVPPRTPPVFGRAAALDVWPPQPERLPQP
jgi:hypothetical protein